jgi:hypothetical protein
MVFIIAYFLFIMIVITVCSIIIRRRGGVLTYNGWRPRYKKR